MLAWWRRRREERRLQTLHLTAAHWEAAIADWPVAARYQGEARARLQGWLLGNLTGDKRLRAGMPAGWRIGEKTGTANGTSNDVGVVWPEGGAPAVVACYLTQCPAAPAQRDAAIAEVGSLAAAWLAAAG